jgi:membrane-bound lytic murein transglycosylase D
MLNNIRDNNALYFKIIDNIFSKKGVPLELKYLAIVESKLKTKAVSRVGAVGAWQFMPATARYLKLKVNKTQDDRKNIYKSTEAAAEYLVTLYKMFDDWLLVLAAYNSGPGTVMNAIKKTGTRNFWKLQYSLPKETRDHVKKYISTHIYYEGSGGITTMTKYERENYEKKYLEYQQQLEEIQPQHMVETSIVLTTPVSIIQNKNHSFDPTMGEALVTSLR